MSDVQTSSATDTSASTSASGSTEAPSQTGAETNAQTAVTETQEPSQPDYSGHKFKVKDFDKKERELSYDEMVRYAQKGFGADKRFEEISGKEKQLTQFYSALQKDFKGTVRALASQLNVDPADLALDLMDEFNSDLEKKQEEAALSPEQRELRDFRREKEERARREAEAKEKEETEARQTAYEAKKQEHYKAFATQIGEALDKVQFIKGDSPAHQAFYDQAVALAATKIQSCLQNRIPYDIQDIAEHVNESIKSQLSLLLAIEDESIFGTYIPEAFMKRVGKFYYNKLNPSSPAAKPQSQASDAKPKDRQTFVHYSDYMKKLG